MNNHFEGTNSKGANLSRFCTIQKEKEPLGGPQFFKPTPPPERLRRKENPAQRRLLVKTPFFWAEIFLKNLHQIVLNKNFLFSFVAQNCFTTFS
jgi:hypothetical protein